MDRINLKGVSFAYGRGFALQRIDLAVPCGEMLAFIGPNGSGKTTLIKLASGVLTPQQGEVFLDEKRLTQMSRRDIARRIAVVPQGVMIPFSFTVREVVTLGRTPFMSAFSGETVQDRCAVDRALELTRMGGFAEKLFNDLSGGERQKVILALALAQDPEVLLLDEPTAYLDIASQVETLELVRKLSRQNQLTVLAAIHDLNLAALYFDRLALLKSGYLTAVGPPDEVITEAAIGDVFGAAVLVSRHPDAPVPSVTIRPHHFEMK
jgi:iron complex transport system ATP-binding protein